MSMAIQRAKHTGDPGFFGDIFRGVTGAVGGLLTGGPLAAITGGIGGFRGSAATRPSSLPGIGPRLQIPAPGPLAATQRFFPGGATGMMAPAPATGSMGGYHLNKSDYFLMSGEFVPAGTRWVRNRKRNPANARATSRAISRVTGAKNYAKSLSRISIRKKC